MSQQFERYFIITELDGRRVASTERWKGSPLCETRVFQDARPWVALYAESHPVESTNEELRDHHARICEGIRSGAIELEGNARSSPI